MEAMGDRFKKYEQVSEQVLPPRLPVIVRLDGNSFSRMTKVMRFQKPFDLRFLEAMDVAATAVMDYCSGSQIAYCYSDEISILLRNDMTHETEPFLANRTQKIVSLFASTASVAFNKVMNSYGMETEAVFDGRTFVVPPSEVTNYFLWRQKDSFRNCMHGVAYYGLREKYGRKSAHKKLHGLSTDKRRELILEELDLDVEDIRTELKRGRCVLRETYEAPLSEVMEPSKFEKLVASGRITDTNKKVIRSNWVVDREIPDFNEDRNYIEKFLYDG